MSVKYFTVEHRGIKSTYALDEVAINDARFDLKKYAEDRAKKQIDYELDEKPKRTALIKEYKHLQNKVETTKQEAKDNLFYTVSPSFISILDEFNLLDLMIEEVSLYNSILYAAIPQLRALADDMTQYRNLMDKDTLNAYWNAEKELQEFIELKCKGVK